MMVKVAACLFMICTWSIYEAQAQARESSVIPAIVVSGVYKSMLQADGYIKPSVWKHAAEVRLRQPWDDGDAEVGTCSLLADSGYLYFMFQIKDSTPNFYYGSDERIVARGDRIEIFFTRSLQLNPYYGLEISPMGLILDYRAAFYRQIDYRWSSKNICLLTHVEPNGYRVEGKIPMKILKGFMSRNRQGKPFLYAGIFSADYHSCDTLDVIWSSWIMPASNHPDFHIPSAFGKLIFNSSLLVE